MKSVTLICGSDNRYAHAAAVAVSSALRHMPRSVSVNVLYLTDNVSQVYCERLKRIVERIRPRTQLTFRAVDNTELSEMPLSGHLTRSSYLRMMFERFLASDVEWALYLDSDTFVLRDLSPLLEVMPGEWTVAATQDYIRPVAKWPSQTSDITFKARYFNAGVLLINVHRWRDLDIETKLISFIREHTEHIGVGCDQDVLNAMLADDWLPLPPEWNLCSQLLYLEEFPPDSFRTQLLARRQEIFDSAAIVHFAGQPKPWDHWCTHPRADDWTRSFIMSGWSTGLDLLWWRVRWTTKRMVVRLKIVLGQLRVRESTRNWNRTYTATGPGA